MIKNLKYVCLIFLVCYFMTSMVSTAYGLDVNEAKGKAEEIKNQISVLENERNMCIEQKNSAHIIAENLRAYGFSDYQESANLIQKLGELWNNFNNREIEINSEIQKLNEQYKEYEMYSHMKYIGDFKLTGYCPCKKCCGKSPSHPAYGITARGTKATEGVTVAMDKRFKFGTKVYIEGLGVRVVEDRGGAIKGSRIDVFCNTHNACFAPQYNQVTRVYVIED